METTPTPASTTLKALHNYLRVLENPPELKRRMPSSVHQRSFKEGLIELAKLAGLEASFFKDPQNISHLVGSQRVVIIYGEPSVTSHVARVFDAAKILFTVLMSPPTADSGSSGQSPASGYRQSSSAPTPPSWAVSNAGEGSQGEKEIVLDSLKPVLTGNSTLTCRIFRVLFEHLLGFGSQASALQGSAALVNELSASKEHGKSFLATAIFVLGVEIDRDNLMSFMLAQGLFGLPLFEQLLQHRDYCESFYSYRKLERAFVASPSEEEKILGGRMDRLTGRYGGRPREALLFEADTQNKAHVDAHLAAVDLLEAMALTPWSMSLNGAIAADSGNAVRSMKAIAHHFEQYADRQELKERMNQEISEHLMAFARQFSADAPPSAAA